MVCVDITKKQDILLLNVLVYKRIHKPLIRTYYQSMIKI